MLTLSVHYEPWNSNRPLKYECVVEFLLFFYKRLSTVAFVLESPLINLATTIQPIVYNFIYLICHAVMQQCRPLGFFLKGVSFLPPANKVWGKVTFLHLFTPFSLSKDSTIPLTAPTPLDSTPLPPTVPVLQVTPTHRTAPTLAQPDSTPGSTGMLSNIRRVNQRRKYLEYINCGHFHDKS